MSRWNLTWLLGVPAALMCGIVFASSARQPEKDYQRIRTIVDVLAEVEDKYVEELTGATTDIQRVIMARRIGIGGREREKAANLR